MSTAGWERMAWYAMRVRKLYCRLWGLDHRVLLDILDRTNGKPLFPALEVLFLDQEPLFHKELLLFISPNLRYFEVVYVTLNQYPRDPRSHCPTEETLVFDALLRLPRRLQTFRLRSCKIMPSNLDRINQLSYLEVLDLVYMNPYTESPLNDLPGLDHLQLFGFAGEYETIHTPFSAHLLLALPAMHCLRWITLLVDRLPKDALASTLHFPCLNILRMMGSCSSKSNFLLSISAPVLYAVFLIEASEMCNSDPWTSNRECMVVLGNRFRETLHRVSLIRVRRDSYGPDEPLMYVLEPLLDITGMLVMEVASSDSFSLEDQDIRRMALSWPSLFALQISGSGGRLKPTLECIRTVVDHLPLLNQLALNIDCSTLSLESLSSIPSTPHPMSMSSLVLTKLRPQDLTLLAKQLTRIFPFLEPDLLIKNWYNPDYVWDDVLEEVRRIQREQSGPQRPPPRLANIPLLMGMHGLSEDFFFFE